jgi:hypothetical protein
MKFYKRDPDRALAGMAALNSAQRGIYNSIIDLLYARDGILPCANDDDDRRIAKNITVDIREWRCIKRQLMELGKIRITNEGLLDANGVAIGLRSATDRSEIARRSVTHRWEMYRLAKQFNAPGILERNTSKSKSKSSELPSLQSMQTAPLVDNGDNSNNAEPETTTKSIASSELRAVMKRKWLIGT